MRPWTKNVLVGLFLVFLGFAGAAQSREGGSLVGVVVPDAPSDQRFRAHAVIQAPFAPWPESDYWPAPPAALRLLADQGDAGAQDALGLRYANGAGIPQDDEQAVNWYRKAANQRYSAAQSNLGWMYQSGWGVAQDYVLAHMWYQLASVSRYSGIRHVASADLRALEYLMTPAQIVESNWMARRWVPR